MTVEVIDSEIPNLISRVFGTDKDLYERRSHAPQKTLKGLVAYTMDNLFDGSDLSDVQVYSYGDEYGFFAINEQDKILRSFGIKKEHRDKKDLFWGSVKEKLGSSFFAVVWEENDRARRFFEQHGGVLIDNQRGVVAYLFNNI